MFKKYVPTSSSTPLKQSHVRKFKEQILTLFPLLNEEAVKSIFGEGQVLVHKFANRAVVWYVLHFLCFIKLILRTVGDNPIFFDANGYDYNFLLICKM